MYPKRPAASSAGPMLYKKWTNATFSAFLWSALANFGQLTDIHWRSGGASQSPHNSASKQHAQQCSQALAASLLRARASLHLITVGRVPGYKYTNALRGAMAMLTLGPWLMCCSLIRNILQQGTLQLWAPLLHARARHMLR